MNKDNRAAYDKARRKKYATQAGAPDCKSKKWGGARPYGGAKHGKNIGTEPIRNVGALFNYCYSRGTKNGRPIYYEGNK